MILALVVLPGLTPGAAAAERPAATLSFHSAPSLHPPAVSVTSDPDGSSGDILLTPYHSYQSGPMILSPSGALIWFEPVPGWAANLEVQRYQGQPVLTWWEGRTPQQPPQDVILNAAYQVVATVHGAGGSPDMHEFQITPQGTALIDVVIPTKCSLASVGGPTQGSADNNVIEEVNIKTDHVVWLWSSMQHVPLTASYQTVPSSGSYDYFHLNSIQQLSDGNLLVSARNTSAVYLIDKQTGNILWTLGGKDSSFSLGSGANFSWQHDAHLTGQTLTLFNDDWGGVHYPQTAPSTALKLHLNTTTMTATLVHSYVHSPSFTTGTQGSAQALPDGNLFVGWGADPDFSEYAPGGGQIFNGNFAFGVKSYRAYRFPWVAQPLTPPALSLALGKSGRVILYASWNGATQVTAWRVLGGGSPNSLKPVARTAKTGFETTMYVAPHPYLAVEALDSNRQVLGISRAEPEPKS